MANPLKQLDEVLKLRRQEQRRIEKLESLLADGTITQGHYASTISDYRSRLNAINRTLETIRAGVRSRLSDARTDEGVAERKLASFQAQHEGPFEDGEKPAREASKLERKLESARARRAELERALAAESPADLRPDGEIQPEDEEEPPPGISAQFPGVSVPERLLMLFRETRNPEAKKPVAVSGAVLAILTVVVLGVLLISGARADSGATANVIGRGEVLVPVLGENLNGIGSVSLTLEYDEDVLTAVEIVPGVLARARTVTSDLSVDGVLSVDVESTYGLDPSGELMLVVFRVDDIVSDRTDIRVSSASALSLDGGTEPALETGDGWVETTSFTVSAPVLRVT
jgi:hypothetical protein